MIDTHLPVLRKEVVQYLNIKSGDIVYDGTLGGAGHTIEIIKAIAPTGKIIGVDLDSQALSTATRNLKEKGFLEFAYLVKDNFANVGNILKSLNIKIVNGFLLDLGLSSIQIEKSERGFSYLRNERLDMRFNQASGFSAYELLNQYTEQKLKEIFYKYGEERWSARISRNIVNYRQKKPLEFTNELVEIIKESIPPGNRRKGHPAKRIFQAIRIEVNKELENLKRALNEGLQYLKPGGRIAVISYHSLEDMVVKNFFASFSGKCICPAGMPVCNCGSVKRGRIITKKPVKPSTEEVEENPRAKSAKLRVFEKNQV